MTLLFAWRYFRGKKSTSAINLIAWISVVAIAVGAAALILVLSVFNGFEGLVKGLYADFYTDIRIAAAKSKFITVNEAQLQKIKAITGVKQICTVAEEKAVLVNGEYQTIIYLKGVDANYTEVAGLSNHITRGAFRLGTAEKPMLVLGSGIANAVGAEPGFDVAPLTVYL